jgi:hypothetical protein
MGLGTTVVLIVVILSGSIGHGHHYLYCTPSPWQLQRVGQPIARQAEGQAGEHDGETGERADSLTVYR